MPVVAVGPWYDRVAAIGHGSSTEITPDEAIEVAKKAQPSGPKDWSSEAKNAGLKPGDWVSVTPDNYGNPIYGRLLAWKAEEVVIRHEDPSVGAVNLHFPLAGFDVCPAEQKKAA